jgi:porphobilinogen synthase
VQQALRALKREVPGLVLITDVCNCEYTSHGHCGKIVDGDVANDPTLEWLRRVLCRMPRPVRTLWPHRTWWTAVWLRSGVSWTSRDLSEFPSLSYAAKFASCFYGPFREAAESTPQFGRSP